MADMESIRTLVPKPIRWIYQWTTNLWKTTQPEQYGEIKGMCDILGAQMGDCILVNTLYELESFCTSIIAKQEDGTIIHGRLMDFSLPDKIR
mmetsp:Transcript_40684/g.29312  ORF Transcript_40684/g.29312 Transcript_40684/m.29312 type:complete len:92 (+) Transcript_40684:166-441(+)